MPISTIGQNGLTVPLTSNTITSATSTALTLQSAGTTAITVDASQNVGIGTASPTVNLDINSSAAGGNICAFRSTATNGGYVQFQGSGSTLTTTGYVGAASKLNTGGSVTDFGMTAKTNLVFGTNDGTERMRISSGGNVSIGTTSNIARIGAVFDGNTDNGCVLRTSTNSGGAGFLYFQQDTNTCGVVSRVGTTSAVTYATTSDYRLKENIAPMTGALSKVVRLKPVTYTWKSGGESAEGFIAHELAEVCPDAVVGTKDAVDADGNPKYQSIDVSFLVATLTAAIQELKTIVDAQAAEIAELKAKVAP